MNKNTKLGTLYIVATPIGNLNDISHRALEILSMVNICAAEDTRKSNILFRSYEIKTRLVSYHKYSEHEKLDYFISKLKSGKDVALISDAGTPLISDPGYLLVKKARKLSIKVIPIPGSSSLTAAISVSGLPINRFTFYGFLPRRIKAKRELIEFMANDTNTSIIFESAKRVEPFLKSLMEVCPEKEVFIAREMTKKYESYYSGQTYKVLEKISSELKGEFVIVIKGSIDKEKSSLMNKDERRILKILLENMKKKDALLLASKIFGINKNSIYKDILRKK
jgi:16S rRNA (cytidine1402-2'-O)-methyltransferase